jgi:Flp pilus assembly protein TadG
MLAPAGFLVLLLLASVSVDSAIAFLGKRQLENAVAAAANDAATIAIPQDQLQNAADAKPDSVTAQRVVDQEVMHPYSGGLTVTDVQTEVDGQTITVTATGTVNYIFAKAIPGVRRSATVKTQSIAIVRFR